VAKEPQKITENTLLSRFLFGFQLLTAGPLWICCGYSKSNKTTLLFDFLSRTNRTKCTVCLVFFARAEY